MGIGRLDRSCSITSCYYLIAQLEAGSFACNPQSPTLERMHKVWQEMKRIIKYRNISVYFPLWGNKNYEEMVKLEGFGAWRELGIQYIVQL